MKILSVLAAMIVLPCSLFAQEENWDTYVAQHEGKPGSVMLDMSLKAKAPIKEFPFVLVAGVSFGNCGVDGLPFTREFANLYKISDSILAVVNGFGKNKLAGTLTRKCRRLDYYYTTDTIGLREELTKYFQRLLPGYTPFIAIKLDEEWTTYLNILYPNEDVYEVMQNQKVLLQLQKGGDKLDQARQIDHWLYFPTDKDRNAFIAYAINHDYKIESKRNDGKLSKPFQLRISKIDKVELNSISRLTLWLRKQAKKYNGDYDGWETFVVK